VSQTSASAPAVLAIDGGRSKTDAVVVATDGTVLAQVRGGPSSHQLVGPEGAIEALDEVIADACLMAGIDLAKPPYVPLGLYCLAGLDLPVDEEYISPAIALRNWTGRDVLRNDTFAVTRAGTSQQWGIGVVCGTGLNCVGTGPDGTVVRFPALDLLSGDFAHGGSWLGVRALGLAQRAIDGRGPATVLTERIPEHFGLPSVEAVLTGVYVGEIPHRRLFELAKTLLDAAADGDDLSREAADYQADEVVRWVAAAVTRLHLTDDAVEVVLGGGLFATRYDAFHHRIRTGVLATAPEAVLIYPQLPPVAGAALIGLDLIGADDAAKDRLRTGIGGPA
jgi:N-acetylglucosamine kinase-like BadF-type ATPase